MRIVLVLIVSALLLAAGARTGVEAAIISGWLGLASAGFSLAILLLRAVFRRRQQARARPGRERC
jgi:hypothetical protein